MDPRDLHDWYRLNGATATRDYSAAGWWYAILTRLACEDIARNPPRNRFDRIAALDDAVERWEEYCAAETGREPPLF